MQFARYYQLVMFGPDSKSLKVDSLWSGKMVVERRIAQLQERIIRSIECDVDVGIFAVSHTTISVYVIGCISPAPSGEVIGRL